MCRGKKKGEKGKSLVMVTTYVHYITVLVQVNQKSKMYMHLKIIINNDNDSNQKELGSSL